MTCLSIKFYLIKQSSIHLGKSHMTRFIFKNNSGRRIEDEYEQESGNRETD